jgi:hypothetical protein
MKVRKAENTHDGRKDKEEMRQKGKEEGSGYTMAGRTNCRSDKAKAEDRQTRN